MPRYQIIKNNSKRVGKLYYKTRFAAYLTIKAYEMMTFDTFTIKEIK